MAYTYHDWEEQATDAARLARLRLHITEVSLGITADVSSDAKSRSTGELRQYLADLRAERDRLETRTRTNGGMGRIRFGKPV